MASGGGIDFSGDGGMDVSQAPMSTNQPEKSSRGTAGPIQFAGDGSMDVGGTIDTSQERGIVPKGGDIVWAGDVGAQ